MVDIALRNETEQLWGLLADYLNAESLELDDLEIAGTGGRRIVRVVVDAEGGIDVDRLADTSRGLSRMLDAQDLIDGSYTLEVTSPGLERKLRRPRHFEKSIGRTLIVKTTKDIGGVRRHDGDLKSVDEHGILIEVEGGTRHISFDEIASARTVFEWQRTPKPGKKSE